MKGQVGVGMSFLTKLNLVEKILGGKQAIIIDPEEEYKEIAKMLNGNIQNEGIIFGKKVLHSSFELIKKVDLNTRCNNGFLGTIGKGLKISGFKEDEFKGELAPRNAKIKHYAINQEKYVLMIY